MYSFSEKGKKTHKTFHILKMKAHFEKGPHFENESLTMFDVNEMNFLDLEF